MKRGFALLAIMLMVAGSAYAKAPQLLYEQALVPGAQADGFLRADFNQLRQDTIWFGGDDPLHPGYAYEGGIWDFEDAGERALQGWTARDLTENDGDYFYRVTATSFASPPLAVPDPCTPMFPGETGELWCGMHEGDANERDWVSGMGYGENWCQKALSPIYTYTAGDVDLAFKYFQYTEAGFDYTYLYVNCFDSGDNLLDEVQMDRLDGEIGSYSAPATYAGTVLAGELPAGTAKVQIEFRVDADGGKDDQDGASGFDSPCGPFAVDEVDVALNSVQVGFYDWEVDEEGWTFERCPGIGSFMQVWPEATWDPWLLEVGVACGCSIAGNVLGCISDIGADLPGYPKGQNEYMVSGILDRTGTPYQPPEYNTTVASWDAYFYIPQEVCTFYRPGFYVYPYSSDVNPTPHWSPRSGQAVYWYVGTDALCVAGRVNNLSTVVPPIDPEWEQMKLIIEILADGEPFGHDPTYCWAQGETQASPLFDNVKLGIFGAADAPPIGLEVGALFHDCFGMRYPTFLDPGDVGNSDISNNQKPDNPLGLGQNQWHSDSAVVAGPLVGIPDARWLCDFMIKVDAKGPRQDMIPGYAEWKARLTGDVEADFVPVLMDSVDGLFGARSDKFATYFHELDPGFDHGHADYGYWQEILPDSLFTPGTRINYYFRSYWYNDGAPPTEYYYYPGENNWWEMEFLPMMRASDAEGYEVEWPCVLYIDAYNRGSEYYINPLLEQEGLEYDKYDYLDASSNYNTPMLRSFGGTHYNPGDWGNNGCTVEQLLGYRLILLNTGVFSYGAIEPEDFDLFDQWLASTACGLSDTRRGFIANGDEIAYIMDGTAPTGLAPDFMHDVLGARWVNTASYRDYNNDWDFCVFLAAVDVPAFEPAAPGVGLYGNGCPNVYNYNVVDVQPGTNGLGNLVYDSYQGGGILAEVEFAQVVNENITPLVANWKTVCDGFSFHHLSEQYCGGEDCSADSVCIVSGAANLLGPELDWIEDPTQPFVAWRYPCEDTGVEDGESHLAGKVNYLYQSRPNPFRSTATIRFSLAGDSQVKIAIFDINGRLVRTLLDGKASAGENSLVWDGSDNAGNRVGDGIFWMQMSTNGFTSSKKMVVLKN